MTTVRKVFLSAAVFAAAAAADCGGQTGDAAFSRVGETRPEGRIPLGDAPPASSGRWRLLPLQGGGFVQNIVFTRNPDVLYMTVDVGGPYRSDDGGRSWRPLHGAMPWEMRRLQLDCARSVSPDPRDENRIVCASGDGHGIVGGIVVSDDGGRSWRQTGRGNYLSNGRRRWMGQLLSRDPNNPDVLVAGGDCTGIVASRDGGETWRQIDGTDGYWFSCIHHDRAVPGRVWACAPGFEDVPEESRDLAEGRAPNPWPQPTRRRGLLRSDDGGATWVDTGAARVPEELAQIDGDPRVVGLFGERESLATYDGGATWEDFSKGLDRLSGNVWDNYGCLRGRYKAIGAGDGFLLVCDTRGNVFRRDAADASWREVPALSLERSEPAKELKPRDNMPMACSIVVDPRNPDRWFVTDWYCAWETTDAGAHWRTRISGVQPLVPFTIDASPFDPAVVFYATADSPMFVSRDGGRSFSLMGDGGGSVLSESVNSVAFSQTTPGLALVAGGKFRPSVRVTEDDGATWRVCGQKGLPEMKPDLKWTRADGFYAAYSVAVHPRRDEFLLAMGGHVGENKGGVYRSLDAGETWEWFGQGLPEGENLFKFMEWGNGEALAVSESGDMMCWSMDGRQVFRRGEGDDRWTKVDFSMRVVDSSGVAVQPSIKAVPGRGGWFFANCGNGEGALFRSTDGGRSFAKSGRGPAGMFRPLAFDRRVPGRFVVPGPGVVYVTDDFGESFSELPGGMDFPSSVNPRFYADDGRLWATGSGSGAWESVER